MLALRTASLTVEIALTIVRDKERPDRAVAIVGSEVAVSAVESGHDPASLHHFEDRPTIRSVPQVLRELQVLFRRDIPELPPVLLEMFLKGALVPEPRT